MGSSTSPSNHVVSSEDGDICPQQPLARSPSRSFCPFSTDPSPSSLYASSINSSYHPVPLLRDALHLPPRSTHGPINPRRETEPLRLCPTPDSGRRDRCTSICHFVGLPLSAISFAHDSAGNTRATAVTPRPPQCSGSSPGTQYRERQFPDEPIDTGIHFCLRVCSHSER